MKLIRYAILFLAVVSLLLVGCSATDAKVIECSNLLFKCSEKDCDNQCGEIATDKGKVLISSESVNTGSGCWCEYDDPDSKIDNNSSFMDNFNFS